mmetsp:Transcript_53580/g.109017  ORF Transcript_53580/g.109017 Transcript_53580/m.109017 type:complete len:425 (+) Transcript_53580:51-1325(+)
MGEQQRRRALLLSRPRRRGGPCLRINVAYAMRNTEALKLVSECLGWECVQKGGHIQWVVRKEDLARSLLQLQAGQWLSHIPGMHEACQKASLTRALEAKQAPFWPRSWRMAKPAELRAAMEFLEANSPRVVIVKPNRGLQGLGISLAASPEELQRMAAVDNDAVVQEYICRPLLIDGHKWDLRLFALVVPDSGHLKCWLAHEGIARVCTEPYQEPDKRNLHKDTIHLTNYSLNKRSEKFVLNEDPSSGRQGSKRTLSAVLLHLQKDQRIKSVEDVWENLGLTVRECIGAMSEELQGFAFKKTCWDDKEEVVQAVRNNFDQNFHILGLDVLLDSSGKPWLLEVNCNPSFSLDEIQPKKDPGMSMRGSATKFGLCNCGAHPQLHQHQMSPVDMAVKLPVLEGAMTLISQWSKSKSASTAGTVYVEL